MTLKKFVCQFCQKTIRKDFVPIQCQTCLAHFHKKCAKIFNNQEIPQIIFTVNVIVMNIKIPLFHIILIKKKL